MNRRNLAAGVSLLALGACATISTATTTSTQAGINQAIAIAQGVLNYIGPVVPLIAAFIPGAAAFVTPAMAAITLASQLLNTLQATMAAADAQPIVGKVVTAIGGLLTAVDQASAIITNPTQQAQVQAVSAAAKGELALLAQLATNIQTVITSPPVPAATRFRGTLVVVPPIFVRGAA
jgi:hypothetical protein